MDRSLIISRTRVEIRKKKAGLQKERAIIRWLQKFFDDMSIEHSSQIRQWQQEAFLSKLKSGAGISREDMLQARSALLFLNLIVFGKGATALHLSEIDSEPGIFKITA